MAVIVVLYSSSTLYTFFGWILIVRLEIHFAIIIPSNYIMPLASWADVEDTVWQYQPKRPVVKVLLEGKFTLIKSNSETVEDTMIYDTLSKCLSTSLPPDSITLIKDSDSPKIDTILKAFKNSPKFCGEYMEYDPDFMYKSVANGTNGVLLWEHEGQRVGIITYRYRGNQHKDVYIDGICMNQAESFHGGGQLLKFFIQCLASVNFKRFSLRSVPSSVQFFTDNGFVKDFFDPDERYIDEYGGPHWPWFTHMTYTVEKKSNKGTPRTSVKKKADMKRWANPLSSMPTSTSVRVTRSKKPSSGGSAGTRMRGDNAGAMSTRNQSKRKRCVRKQGTRKQGTRKQCK